MAKARRDNTAMVLGVVRRNRRSLMMGTALQASVMLVLSLPAGAQPAPNARPAGGTVAAGSAVISRSTNNTQIDQASQRAAIDWRSFDVGSQQRVTFSQPSASAVALNRVTGPDPSQIAGRIEANGQFILVNQSGVNFYKGAQVNAASVMVSTANISNQNFMAGAMKFDQPSSNPNAKIDNQGTITVKQAGLAALVAPQVANSGTISAKLGHVVLAGAKTATLDLFGDGLLSLDVSNQVMQTPVGKDGKAAAALVTNTGVIVADGGTVQLTARAADGIVQNLVQAGGTISAATIGDQSGVVALNGVGGSIVVEGQLSAPGLALGTKGGAIEVVSNRDVTIASTATINASGKAGGGVVAIGTTLDRARGGPAVTPTKVAANVSVKQGAKVSADGSGNGTGGKVVVLSAGATRMDGLIAAKGSPSGGAGGFVEVSGNQLGMTTGKMDVSAPAGRSGTILLDPRDLDIVVEGNTMPTPTGLPVGNPNQDTDITVGASALTGLTGNLLIEASRDLTVDAPLSFTAANSVKLLAGNDLIVNQPISTAFGSLTLSAAVATDGITQFTHFNPLGTLTINANVGSATTGAITLSGGNVQILNSNVTNSGFGNISVTATNTITQSGNSLISATDEGTVNITTTTGDLIQAGNSKIIGDTINAHIGGNISQSGQSRISVDDANSDEIVSITAGGNFSQTGTASISAGTFGSVTLTVAGAITQSGGGITADTLAASAGGAVTLNGALTARAMAISATGSMSLGGDITTGGLPSFTTTIPTTFPTNLLATAGGAFFNVLPDASGGSSFTASTNVLSLDANGTFLLVSMPPQGGTVGLTKLNAPGTQFVLNLGSGNASGQIDVGSLLVLGTGGQVNFTNSTVQGLTGSAAALAGVSVPPANPAYLLDGCVIGVGCGAPQQQPPQLPPLLPPIPPVVQLPPILQGVSVSSGILNIVSSLIQDASAALVQSGQEANPRGVPILNPMRDLSGGPLRDRQSDPDLMLPNVSEKDY